MSPEEIARTRRSPKFQKALAQLGDPDWRIDNLYKIQDEGGNEVLFKRNSAQRHYWDNRHRRDVIPKARQLGFSTVIGLEALDLCVFRKNTRAGIVDYKLADATKKLARIKYAYERLPESIKKAARLTTDRAEMLAWSNGSNLTVGTSYRGDTAQFLHVSEYGKTSVEKPGHAKEIKTGAIRAVHLSGRVVIESTAHGTSGEFYSYVDSAKKLQLAGTVLTPLDYRLHFYGWWVHAGYRIANNLVQITKEMHEYFDKLQSEYGIKLDADQKAWYQKMRDELGPDDMRSEFPSTVDEAFFNSLAGSYFKDEINRARRDKRIGLPVPFDPSRRVNTFWDIGEDGTVIWFHQTDGLRHHFIDYFEEEGGSLQKCAAVLDEKRRERGFIYDKHYGPHDLEHRDWAHESKTRRETALDLGIEFTVVQRVEHKDDSISAARAMLNFSWFCSEHCERGVKGLENYRKTWNDKLGIFRPEPVHDWSSHIADAFQQGALDLKRGREAVRRSRRSGDDKRGTAWSA